MVAVPSPDEDPNSWDQLILEGELLPGTVVCTFPSKRDYDKKKAKGNTKATIKDNGDPAREPAFVWQFDAEKDWPRFLQVWPMIHERKPGAEKKPLKAVHPRLALANIPTIIIEEVDGPNIDRGLATVNIKTVEVAKPVPQKSVSLQDQINNLAALEMIALASFQIALAQKYHEQRAALEKKAGKPSATAAKTYAPPPPPFGDIV